MPAPGCGAARRPVARLLCLPRRKREQLGEAWVGARVRWQRVARLAAAVLSPAPPVGGLLGAAAAALLAVAQLCRLPPCWSLVQAVAARQPQGRRRCGRLQLRSAPWLWRQPPQREEGRPAAVARARMGWQGWVRRGQTALQPLAALRRAPPAREARAMSWGPTPLRPRPRLPGRAPPGRPPPLRLAACRRALTAPLRVRAWPQPSCLMVRVQRAAALLEAALWGAGRR